MNFSKQLHLSVLLAFTLASLIFVFDLMTPLGVAGGVPYVGLVLIALVARLPKTALWLAVLGSALTVLGYFASPAAIAPGGVVIINRLLAVLAIWATAIVTYLHLKSLAELAPLADHDELTGLYNRRYFNQELGRQMSAWRRYGNPLSLIMLDIDHFKNINDTHGHAAGDRVLRALADILRQHTREIDTVCRYGGEEFVILLPFTDLKGAVAKAQRIRRAVAGCAVPSGRQRIDFRVSLGVVELGDPAWDAATLIAAADQAMYRAKNEGRDRVVAVPAPKRHPRRRALVRRLLARQR